MADASVPQDLSEDRDGLTADLMPPGWVEPYPEEFPDLFVADDHARAEAVADPWADR